jgi:apolipoprotein D and lipocalin family protein
MTLTLLKRTMLHATAAWTGLAVSFIAAANPLTPPTVVDTVDLERYMGTWFEIASNRPAFQADCFCTTAQYTLIDTAKPLVAVRNSCNRGSATGNVTTVDGEATIPNLAEPAKISVKFGPFSPPLTNYWIVALADDYSWAVVSSAVRSPLYILARDRALPQETVNSIVADLEARGFNTSILDFTVQNGCR